MNNTSEMNYYRELYAGAKSRLGYLNRQIADYKAIDWNPIFWRIERKYLFKDMNRWRANLQYYIRQVEWELSVQESFFDRRANRRKS